MSFVDVMGHVAQAFEAFGVGVLVVGLLWSLGLAGTHWRRSRDGRAAYRLLRTSFGGVLLLGLEVLVAADLIKTVAVATTLENVVVLGIIVLIRTLLSFSLEVEIEGTLPWRRAASSGAGLVARAATEARDRSSAQGQSG